MWTSIRASLFVVKKWAHKISNIASMILIACIGSIPVLDRLIEQTEEAEKEEPP